MSELDKLAELQETLNGFVQGGRDLVSAQPPDPMQWQRLAGGYDLLRRALREAVGGASEGDPSSLLNECWALLRAKEAKEQMVRYYLPNRRVDSERLQGNACALLATAQAAIALRQAISHEGAWERFMGWWRRAAESFRGSVVPDPPTHTLCWVKADPGNALELLDYSCGIVGAVDWPVEALRYWTQYWLSAKALIGDKS